MRAVVLGAAGHIGAHVVRALQAEGHTVRAIYRNPRYLGVLDGLDLERIQADLENEAALIRAVEGAEWVFHAAGFYPPARIGRPAAVRKGIESTRRILEAVTRTDPRRVVFTSSAATIRAIPDRSADESDAEPWPLIRWRNLYSTVKIAMEQEALKAARAGLPVVIVNPSLCLGEYDARCFSGRALLAFAKHRVPCYTETTFNAVYTGDVGMGHLRAAERGRLGERYLLTGENIRLKEFADIVCVEMGLPSPRWRIPFAVAMASAIGVELAARIFRTDPLFTREEVRRVRRGYLLDGSKAVKELGVPQTPVKEAVRRAVGWFRKEGILS